MVIQILSQKANWKQRFFFPFFFEATRPAQSARQYLATHLGHGFDETGQDATSVARGADVCESIGHARANSRSRKSTEGHRHPLLTSRSKCRYGWPRHRHHSPKRPGILCFTDSVVRRLPAGPNSNEALTGPAYSGAPRGRRHRPRRAHASAWRHPWLLSELRL
jgi:hypothetical protein